MGGYIMQLQNMSVNDGSGIRTIVFMAGCPLRCAWCSNPEGQTTDNIMVHYAETQDILKEIDRQSVFFRFSGGGVTFSGGEATAQPAFLNELSEVLYDRGFDLAIETCGLFDWEAVEPALGRMSTVFMDLKHPDSAEHRRLTGAGNELILENMARASKLQTELVVRIPAVAGANADDETMEAAFELIKKTAPDAEVELLPYHEYGLDKYRKLGRELPPEEFSTPPDEDIERWLSMAEKAGLRTVSFK
ncbi:MAG: radical SAM protein [Anaerovoracaceae bacterium]|jgi:pyruvate formate lyase activating enzyme